MSDFSEILPGDYVAGFVDGEGCFYLTYRSETRRERSGSPIYYRWISYFAITLREDDLEILQLIRDSLGCGNIYLLNNKRGGKHAYLGIQNLSDLHEKVLPFFNKNKLRAKKRHDFMLWCEALEILYKNKMNRTKCSQEDHIKLFGIRNKMNLYKARIAGEYKNNPELKQL